MQNKKVCRVCGTEYPATTEYFGQDKTGKYGLRAQCKKCRAKLRKVYHPKDREKYLEKRRAIWRAYYARHHDRVLERERKRARRMYESGASPDVKERNKQNSKIHRGKLRALEAGAEGTYTVDELRQQLKAQNMKCYYCGSDLYPSYHLDHIVPLSRSGRHSADNIVLTCPACNLSKRDKLPHEWKGTDRLL